MHTISKIFNSLEKIAAFKQRELQATREMEKAAATVSRGLLKLLRARKSFITKALKKNPALSRKEALASFYKKYGLQVGKGGKLSAIKDVKLSKSLAAKQQEWLKAMRENRSLSHGISALRRLQATDPSRVGKALAAMSKKFNLSEANKDFILAQQGGRQLGRTVNIAGKPMRFSYDQQVFKLNRKPSSLARSLRRRKPAPDVPPGPNPPGPNPPGPNPPGPNPPGPNPPGPNPPGPNPPGGGGTPKPGPDPAPKPGAGGEGGQYGPNSPDTPVTSPLGNPNNNWWKWLLGGAAGGYTLRAITEPQPEPQDFTANSEAQYANSMMNGMQY